MERAPSAAPLLRRTGPFLAVVLALSTIAAACSSEADPPVSVLAQTVPESETSSAAPDLGDEPSATATTTTTTPLNPVAKAFAERRDRYLTAMLEATPGNFDHGSATAVLVLDAARRTGDDRLVADANDRILETLGALEPSTGTNQMGILHGAAYTFLHLALEFGDEPELLYPGTYEAIVRGEFPDGVSRPEQSLLAYRDQMFESGYDSQNLGLDVRSGNPWDPSRYGSYNGTENHKLQAVTTALLLAELYAGDVVGGVAVRDDTPELDDQWHYFRDAFFRLSDTWPDGGADHFRTDVMSSERDSVQYLPTHLGDYWFLLNLSSDPVIRAHARVFIDRLLVDWAEDLIGPMQTGASERIYNVDLEAGLSDQQHVLNFLLFDNLGEPIGSDHPELYNFGGWANLAVAVSDYTPGSPEFPDAVIDLAVDKGDDGYEVRESGSDYNWVESDLALGFRLDGRLFSEDRIGGFFVLDDEPGSAAGRMVTMFHGDTPFSKEQVPSRPAGVQDGRVAVIRSETNARVPSALWIHPGFDAVMPMDDRIVVTHRSAADREVYLSITTAGAAFVERDPVDGGRVFETSDGAVTVWEVATSDQFSTVEEFVTSVAAGTFGDGRDATADGSVTTTVAIDTEPGETVVSGLSGQEFRLTESLDGRSIDGQPLDWSAYDYSFSNPWAAHRRGTTTAGLERNGASVAWDWSPDDSGSFEREPTGIVDNGD